MGAVVLAASLFLNLQEEEKDADGSGYKKQEDCWTVYQFIERGGSNGEQRAQGKRKGV